MSTELRPCPRCRRHRRGGACPFCGAEPRSGTTTAAVAAALMVGLAACPKQDAPVTIYAGPPPDLAEDDGGPPPENEEGVPDGAESPADPDGAPADEAGSDEAGADGATAEPEDAVVAIYAGPAPE